MTAVRPPLLAKEAGPLSGLASAKDERRLLCSSFFTALAAICSAQVSVRPKVRSEMFAAPPPSEPSSDLPTFGLLILRPRLGELLLAPPRQAPPPPPPGPTCTSRLGLLALRLDVPQGLTSLELLGLRAEPSPRAEPLPATFSWELRLNFDDAAITSWSCGEHPELRRRTGEAAEPTIVAPGRLRS